MLKSIIILDILTPPHALIEIGSIVFDFKNKSNFHDTRWRWQLQLKGEISQEVSFANKIRNNYDLLVLDVCLLQYLITNNNAPGQVLFDGERVKHALAQL